VADHQERHLEFGGAELRLWRQDGRLMDRFIPPAATCQRRRSIAQSEEDGIMLVLSRKKNESIVINKDITIVIVEIRGDKVRLGVEAPKEVPVHRREVFDAIEREHAEQREQIKPAA
jgi:carbon storage regulator